MAANDKLQRIQSLSQRMPVLNEQARKRIDAGRALQLQQLAQQAGPQAGVREAQQVGAALQAQAGQQAVQQQAQQQAQAAQVGQMALGIQGQQQQLDLQRRGMLQQGELARAGMQQQAQLGREERTLKTQMTQDEVASARRIAQYGLDTDNTVSFMSRKQREDLSKLGRDVKSKIFDSRLQFERDESGRKFSNERQLMDFAVASAKSEQDLQTKMQTMQQTAQKEITMLEIAHTKIVEALQRGYLDEKRELDQNMKAKLAEMKGKMEREIQRKKARAANQRMIVGGIMVAAGAAMTATGVGAPAGAPLMAAGAGYAAGGGQ